MKRSERAKQLLATAKQRGLQKKDEPMTTSRLEEARVSFEKAELSKLMRRLPALDGKEPQSNIECVIEVLHAIIDILPAASGVRERENGRVISA